MATPKPTTVIVNADAQVNQALRAIGLTREIVRAVVDAAVGARAVALEIDANGTPGQFSYIYGVRAIRLNLLPIEGWRVSKAGNVESTINDTLGVQICFQNVHRACGEEPPQAVSGKGAGARDLVTRGLFDSVADREKAVDKIGQMPTVWFICVSVNGNSVRAEVSCPKSFEGNQFDEFVRRIFVVDETIEPKPTKKRDSGHDDMDDFDVAVSRK